MYGPPRYDTYDPTPAVALWWNLFFAFMLGDAGFGLMITLVSLYGLKKIKSMEKILRLCLNVGVGTMIIGIIMELVFYATTYDQWESIGAFLPRER